MEKIEFIAVGTIGGVAAWINQDGVVILEMPNAYYMCIPGVGAFPYASLGDAIYGEEAKQKRKTHRLS